MNKYLLPLSFAFTLMFGIQITATTRNDASFKQLIPYTIKDAQEWVKSSIAPLEINLQLAYLNLFALNSPQSVEAFKQCLQFIEKRSELTAVHDALSNNIMNAMQKYIQSVQDKIAATKKPLSKAEEAKILEMLRNKIQELVILINAIHYETLYKHIAANDPQALKYIFDNNGLIAEDKRTKALPKSI